MKRCCAILSFLVMLVALLVSCSSENHETPKFETPEITPSPAISALPSAIMTTPPDMEYIDFTGSWIVSAVIDSHGKTIDGEQLSQMNADFSLEFSKNGTYLIYDKMGAPLGQGNYRVNQNMMILSAGGAETIYTIVDSDTLQCTAEDGSITVMSRFVVSEDIEEEDVSSS